MYVYICFVFKKIFNDINLVSQCTQIICVPFVLARMSTGKYSVEEEKFNFKTNPYINIYIVNSTWYLIDCALKKVWRVILRYWRLINSFNQKIDILIDIDWWKMPGVKYSIFRANISMSSLAGSSWSLNLICHFSKFLSLFSLYLYFNVYFIRCRIQNGSMTRSFHDQIRLIPKLMSIDDERYTVSSIRYLA